MIEMTEWNERKPVHVFCTMALCVLAVGIAVTVAAWFGIFDARQMGAFALFCIADGIIAFCFALGTREYEAENGKCLIVRSREGSILALETRVVICKPLPLRRGFRVEQKEGGRPA